MLLAAAVLAAVIPSPPLPPAPYDKPYTGKLTVVRVSLKAMPSRCGGPAYACALPMGVRCTIYLPTEAKGELLSRLRRHEIGHCVGWPAHHPGGIFR